MEHLLDDRANELYGANISPCEWLGYVHKNAEESGAKGVSTKLRNMMRSALGSKGTVPATAGTSGSYAESQGWNATKSSQLQVPNHDALADQKAVGRLQSLLFFGVLERLFDAPLLFKDYVFKTTDGLVLRTTALRPLVQNMYAKINRLADIDDQSTLDEIGRTLRREHQVLIQWYVILRESHKRQPKTGISGISVLCRQTALILDVIADINHEMRTVNCDVMFEKAVLRPVNDDFYLERLRSCNFCPSQLERFKSWKISTLEYACILTPGDESQEYRHVSCTRQTCSINNVTTSTFRARHLSDGCECDWINIPLSSIEKILDAENYFVLHVPTLMDPHNAPGNALRPYSKGLPYVSISHVWSHGAGSDADDGLPRCRLQSIIDRLPDQSCDSIWVDSLCIPRDEKLKMKSISMMDSIYRNAAAVISMDRDLLSISTEKSTTEALGIRFLTCDWNRRLWTFQEALLARKLYIAFKDQTISAQDLVAPLKERLSSGIALRVNREIHRLISPDRSRLMYNLVMLRDRSSSVYEDETLVIGTIAGLDMSAVTRDYHDDSLKQDEAMKNIWLMIGKVHHSIIFTRAAKIQYPGFRFAPRSFMHPFIADGFDYYGTEDSRITEKGISARFLAIKLGQPYKVDGIGPAFTIQMPARRLHLIHRDDKAASFDTVVVERIPKGPSDYMYAVGLCKKPADDSDGKTPCYSYTCDFSATMRDFHRTKDLESIEGADPVRMRMIIG